MDTIIKHNELHIETFSNCFDHIKVDVPNSVSDFKCYMVGCESKNIHQKYTCWKEIGVHAQYIFKTILDAIVNIIGETYTII